MSAQAVLKESWRVIVGTWVCVSTLNVLLPFVCATKYFSCQAQQIRTVAYNSEGAAVCPRWRSVTGHVGIFCRSEFEFGKVLLTVHMNFCVITHLANPTPQRTFVMIRILLLVKEIQHQRSFLNRRFTVLCRTNKLKKQTYTQNTDMILHNCSFSKFYC